MFVCRRVCEYRCHKSQRRVSDSRKLKLQVAVSHQHMCWNGTWCSTTAAHTLNPRPSLELLTLLTLSPNSGVVGEPQTCPNTPAVPSLHGAED